MDRILFGASLETFDDCLQLARRCGVGLELQAFAYPKVLDGDWKSLVEHYQKALLGLPGERAMHGPFLDMASGSPDPQIRAVVKQRMIHSLEIADQLHVKTIVFHANFISTIRTEAYRREWLKYEIDFWGPMAEHAARLGITLALENMWEFDPNIIGDVLSAVHSANLMACLDVGHAALFSDFPLQAWIEVLAPYLIHTHLNNNLGEIDEHRGFDDGVLDYHVVLPMLRSVAKHPVFSLEIGDVDAIQRSLHYLQLPATDKRATQIMSDLL